MVISTPAEPDAAVGQGLVVEAGVVDPVVVLGAERYRVGEVGAAASGPGLSVVELAPGVGAFAAGGGAGGVFEAFGHSLGFGEESALAAEVESHGLGAEDGGEDAGVAGEASGFAGGERWSVSRWAAFIAPARTVWSMVTTTVAAVLGCRWSVGRCSRSSANARPRRCRQSKDRSCVAGRLAHPSGCGHRVDDLAEHRRCQGGDGEVSGGGAVAVVVQRQRALLPGGLLLASDELVLVGVHDRSGRVRRLRSRGGRGGGAGRD